MNRLYQFRAKWFNSNKYNCPMHFKSLKWVHSSQACYPYSQQRGCPYWRTTDNRRQTKAGHVKVETMKHEISSYRFTLKSDFPLSDTRGALLFMNYPCHVIYEAECGVVCAQRSRWRLVRVERGCWNSRKKEARTASTDKGVARSRGCPVGNKKECRRKETGESSGRNGIT